jgi:prepilin-type processing-associated H-X9-DG protein
MRRNTSKRLALNLVELPAVNECDRTAFTLVELLVVIGIIALLIGVLLPALIGARQRGYDLKCASNVRQLCVALVNYSVEFKGKFPPNIGASGPDVNWWYDADRIGRFLPKTTQFGTSSVGGTVFICPNDENALRSYGFNVYASSAVDTAYQKPPFAKYFSSNSKPATALFLIGETYSRFTGTTTGGSTGYATGNVVGLSGTSFASATSGQGNYPGKRWIGNLSIDTSSRFGIVPCEFDYSRHRKRGEGHGTESKGRMNIGFADGHVEMIAADDLCDRTTLKSKFRALWSPMDADFQRKYLP